MTDETSSPAGAHVDLETLADHDEDLLGADEAAGVERHLADCRVCRERKGRLRATRALLSTLPPVPMPEAVAQRLERAVTEAPSPVTVLPLTAGARSRTAWFARPSAAGLAAAAAVVALVAAVVVGTTRHDDKAADTAGSAPGGAVPETSQSLSGSYPVSTSDRRYTPRNASKRIAAVAADLAPAASATADAGTPGPSVKEGGVTSQSEALSPRLDAALLPMVSSQVAQLECVAALTAGGPATLPIAIDFGRFTDRRKHLVDVPAIVVLLPGPPGKVDGWIVGPDCATAPDNNLYLFERVPVSG